LGDGAGGQWAGELAGGRGDEDLAEGAVGVVAAGPDVQGRRQRERGAAARSDDDQADRGGPSMRAPTLGNTLIGFMRSLSEWDGEELRTHTRTVAPNPGEFSPLLFMAGSEFSDLARQALTFRMELFHHDYHQAAGTPDGATVAIMLTPSHDPERRWDTTMRAAQGDQGHSPETIAELRAIVTEAREHRSTTDRPATTNPSPRGKTE
jgi:hypothetical protein